MPGPKKQYEDKPVALKLTIGDWDRLISLCDGGRKIGTVARIILSDWLRRTPNQQEAYVEAFKRVNAEDQRAVAGQPETAETTDDDAPSKSGRGEMARARLAEKAKKRGRKPA